MTNNEVLLRIDHPPQERVSVGPHLVIGLPSCKLQTPRAMNYSTKHFSVEDRKEFHLSGRIESGKDHLLMQPWSFSTTCFLYQLQPSSEGWVKSGTELKMRWGMYHSAFVSDVHTTPTLLRELFGRSPYCPQQYNKQDLTCILQNLELVWKNVLTRIICSTNGPIWTGAWILGKRKQERDTRIE